MSNYRHILVAVDVTEEAVDVLARAMLIAQKNDATLSLITVVRPLTYAYTGIEVAGLAAAAIDFERQAKASVEKTLSRLCEAHDLQPANTLVVFGTPATAIKNQATAIDADLIVLGSHGKHGLGLLLGSTANGVLHGADCDVFTVRIGAD